MVLTLRLKLERASTAAAAYSEYKHVLANILRSRYVARTPPLEARSPDRRSNVENAPPSTASYWPASHARFPYTACNFENAPRHPPVTGQQRAHTPPSVRTMSSYHGMDANL